MAAKYREKDKRYEITRYIGGKKKHFYGRTEDEANEKMWREIIQYKDHSEDYALNKETFGEIRKKWYRNKCP